MGVNSCEREWVPCACVRMGVNACECVFYQELDVFSDLGVLLTQQRPAVQDVRNKGGAADRVTWDVTPAFS